LVSNNVSIIREVIIAMSQKERQRCHLLKMVIGRKTTSQDASRLMGIPYQHAKRLKRKLVIEGARGSVHGSRSRASSKV